ncbi:hypothetical protein FHR36_007777 [Kitasatospora paracochleata]|uniref:Uncharacterized protein n=1 Tax=Kitasatospora paracochleata TaxID=58354 RepID=A0ABT1JCY6_9ACTN|nr:hypothetical protein [Kitasatospora paracochleata]
MSHAEAMPYSGGRNATPVVCGQLRRPAPPSGVVPRCRSTAGVAPAVPRSADSPPLAWTTGRPDDLIGRPTEVPAEHAGVRWTSTFATGTRPTAFGGRHEHSDPRDHDRAGARPGPPDARIRRQARSLGDTPHVVDPHARDALRPGLGDSGRLGTEAPASGALHLPLLIVGRLAGPVGGSCALLPGVTPSQPPAASAARHCEADGHRRALSAGGGRVPRVRPYRGVGDGGAKGIPEGGAEDGGGGQGGGAALDQPVRRRAQRHPERDADQDDQGTERRDCPAAEQNGRWGAGWGRRAG